jgi:HK97 family phage major capsid protein
MNKRLLEIRTRKLEIRSLLQSDAECDLASIQTELAALDTEERSINQRIELAGGIPEGDPVAPASEQRGEQKQPQGDFNPMGTYTGLIQQEKRGFDKVLDMPTSTDVEKAEMRQALFSTAEYRSGFLKSLKGNTLTDAETRALTIVAGSGGAVVPTVTYDLIVKRLIQVSALFGRIKKTFIPANVTLPVANPQVASAWSDSAPSGLLTGSASDDTVLGVSLSSYVLSKFATIKGQLLLMSIDAFESYVVSAISDQLGVAIENAIINGTGTGMPTGIIPGVTWSATNFATWEAGATVGYTDLVNARALLKLYRTGAVWIMNSNMEAQIFNIKTTTAQPLFTQNPITGLIANPLGMEIVVDYYMPDNTIIIGNLDYYYMNITQNPTILTDDSSGFLSTSRMYRGTMFCDAKPALSEAFVQLSMAAS